MAASITDKFTYAATTNTRPTPTTVSSIRAQGGTTLQCLALTGWPTGSAVHFCTYQVNTSNQKVAGTQVDWKGIVSGTTITNLTVTAGTDTGNSVGDIVEAAPTAGWANDLVAGILAHANEDGSLTTAAVQTALNLGAGALNGWNVYAFPPSTVVANGNRSYTLTITGQDATGTLSPGMRIKTTRTVTAPTQCTSLNGSTQYWSKTSPAGMTFTNNFVVSAWVKLSSYADSRIASRYNGTSGWGLAIASNGTIYLAGYNGGSGNNAISQSYQSVPLNKWVHIAAQLDMTTTSVGGTNNYIMIDGVEVPNTFTRAGTNPTALVQAGNLEIGSQNGGTSPFPGKIAQVAIYSAKVTEATILASMHQTLAGTETSLISAYAFNGNANDLNANANNLTANGAAAATATDTPFTQTNGLTGYTVGTTNFGVIQSATFSTNTTVVVQVPEGDTIPTSGGVSALSYSTQKVPYGFPAQRAKWQVISLFITRTSLTEASTSTWYNQGQQITIPTGEWQLSYNAYLQITNSAQSGLGALATLSSANNTQDLDLTVYTPTNAASSAEQDGAVVKSAARSLAAQTTYYLNTQPMIASSTVYVGQGLLRSACDITAENAYL